MNKHPREAADDPPPHAFEQSSGVSRSGSRYVDFDPAGYFFQPCSHCTSGWPEIVRADSATQVVREWHDANCPALAEWE